MKLEMAESILRRVLVIRINSHIFSLIGKQSEGGGDAWHFVLVDWDKIKKFLEDSKTGTVCAIDYGKIIAMGVGHEIPQEVLDTPQQFTEGIKRGFQMLRFGPDESATTYYVMADVGKELQMKAASSIEQIKSSGKILYSACDDDPAEALVYVIEEEYFGFDREIILNVESPIDAVVSVEKLTEYLEARGDVNCVDRRGWTLLHRFAQRNDLDALNLLKNNGAEMQVRDRICGRKPILIAAREGHIDAMEFFLQNSGDVNDMDNNGWTLAHYAAWNGNKEAMTFLIQKDAKTNAKEITAGKLPIHIAAELGNTDVLKILLEKDANIEVENDDEKTPLFYAALVGQEEIVRYLIDAGANISYRIAHAATVAKNIEIIDLLLSKGLDVNEPDKVGLTLLHRAVAVGDFKMVKFLVDKKADLNAVSDAGLTPFSLSKQHPDIAVYLGDKLGAMLQKKENYRGALSFYREIFEIQKKILTPLHPETLKVQNQVATMLYKLSRYDEAVDTFKAVLEAREESLGAINMLTLCTKHGLGLVYPDQMKYQEAMEIFEDVFEKRKDSLGPDHHDTLIVLYNIGNLHLIERRYDEARNIFEDVLKKRRAQFGADHPDTLQVSQDLAMALLNKGEYRAAMEILDDVLQRRKRTLGDNDPLTLSTEHEISSISETFKTQIQEQGCFIQ